MRGRAALRGRAESGRYPGIREGPRGLLGASRLLILGCERGRNVRCLQSGSHKVHREVFMQSLKYSFFHCVSCVFMCLFLSVSKGEVYFKALGKTGDRLVCCKAVRRGGTLKYI